MISPRLTLGAVLLALAISACSGSLVYDPFLIPPSRPLGVSEAQAAVGIGLMPEARPVAVGRTLAAGGTALLRGGFSDRTSVGVRSWMTLASLDPDDYYRGGIQGDVWTRLSDTGAVEWSAIGRAAMVWGQQGGGVPINGGGFVLQLGRSSELFPGGAMHLAAGPLFGFRDLTEPDEWGAGFIVNAALSVAITSNVDASLEGAGAAYYDAEHEIIRAIAAPMLSVSVRM